MRWPANYTSGGSCATLIPRACDLQPVPRSCLSPKGGLLRDTASDLAVRLLPSFGQGNTHLRGQLIAASEHRDAYNEGHDGNHQESNKHVKNQWVPASTGSAGCKQQQQIEQRKADGRRHQYEPDDQFRI